MALRRNKLCSGALGKNRRPRPLSLTQAGARLYPVLQASFDAIEAGIAALREAEERRPLRVTTTNAFAHRWLVPRLPLWRAAYPGRALEVIGTDAVVDLRTGQADIAIRYARTAPGEPILALPSDGGVYFMTMANGLTLGGEPERAHAR